MKSRFRCDLTVEVVDKDRISQVKVATIDKIVGKRLQLRYYDSKPSVADGKLTKNYYKIIEIVQIFLISYFFAQCFGAMKIPL